MDAWRFRAAHDGALDQFWRDTAANLAAAAPSRLSVRLEPSLARPGDRVLVRAAWRRTELLSRDDRIEIPPISGAVVTDDGRRQMIRLWPGSRPGTFEGAVTAPSRGYHVVSVSGEGRTADAVLRIEDDIIHPERDTSRAAAFTAEATGGAVVRDPADLRDRISTIGVEAVERQVYPMRSAWWILPFAALLCAEWTLRRRRGLP
jgi:hypothetical protein